jgi:predicted metal-dependent hydrolase
MMGKTPKLIIVLILSIFLFQGTSFNYFVFAQGPASYNQNVIRETQRLDPLLIFSNTSPKEFNEKMAKAISQALGEDIYTLISPQELANIINQAIEESQTATFQELLEKVKESIAKESREKIIENLDEKLKAPPTAYAKAVVRKKLAEELNKNLKTDWDPWVEQALVENASAILTEIIAQNAGALLHPELYLAIHQRLQVIFNTQVKEIPPVSELLSKKLIDYMPKWGADFLGNLNELISGRMEKLKQGISTKLYESVGEPITSAITKILAGIFPASFSGFLDVLQETMNEILRQAISAYVDHYVTEFLRENLWDYYNFQKKLKLVVEGTIYDALPPKIKQNLQKTLFELLPKDAQSFFADFDATILAIADALSQQKEEAKQAVEKTTDKKVFQILFPGLEEFLNKTLYQVLIEIKDPYGRYPFKDIFEFNFANELPKVLTQSLYEAFPKKAKTPIVDLLSKENSETLKTKRLIDLVKDEEKKRCLTTPWGNLSPQEQQKCLGVLNERLLDMMEDNAEVLTKTILEMMTPENKSFFTKKVIELFPEQFRNTPFQTLGIDATSTPENEARQKSIMDFASEDLKIFIDLINQYLPKKKDRPQAINDLLEILNKTPYQFIADPPSAHGLGKPEIAQELDTPLPNLLPNTTSTSYLTQKTMLDILAEVGFNLNQSLLSTLKDKDPKLYEALTTKIGDKVSENDLRNNPQKTILEIFAKNLGDESVAQKLEKPIIQLQAFSFLSKTPLQLIQEKQGSKANQVFSKSFWYYMPQEVKDNLAINFGQLITKDPNSPMNKKMWEFLPENWQKKISEYFALTPQDIDDALTKAFQNLKPSISRSINSMMTWTVERFSKMTGERFMKKLSEKIGTDITSQDKLDQISKNITDALDPIVQKAIKEKIEKGYLINSLDEIK